MLLKVIDDIKRVANMQHDLINDLIAYVQEENKEKQEPAVAKFKQRAEEAERLLDTIEYNSRRI